MAHALPSQILTSCNKGIMYCFSDWANDVSLGAFWVFMLLGFATVIAMATWKFGVNRAIGFGSFVGMIGAIWLTIMQLIPWWTASAFILAGVGGIAIMIISEKQ